MSEPTREDMLEALRHCWDGSEIYEQEFNAIRRLIEQGKPTVSRGWIEDHTKKIWDKYHDWTLRDYPILQALITLFREAGVEVEDE